MAFLVLVVDVVIALVVVVGCEKKELHLHHYCCCYWSYHRLTNPLPPSPVVVLVVGGLTCTVGCTFVWLVVVGTSVFEGVIVVAVVGLAAVQW